MPESDVIREVLIVLRDSLEPKVKALLDRAVGDEIDILKDREILEQGDGLDTLDLNDPIQILNVLQNLGTHRSILFAGVADGFVLERIATVRRLRNSWAHFGPQPTDRSIHAVRWLLEKSNDRDACVRVDKLIDAPRQARRSTHTSKVDAEVNRRASQVAEDEQRLQKLEVKLDQDAQSLVEREIKVKQREDEYDNQRHVAAREREDLTRRRAALDDREQALTRIPTEDDIRRRERDVAAEEVVVSQLRQDYESLLNDVRRRSHGLEQQQADVVRRSEELDVRQTELEQLRAEASALSERLNQSVERLEHLERRQRQVVFTGESVPSTIEQATPTEQPKPTNTSKLQTSKRPCRRTGCEGSLENKSGRFGEFFGCTKYPACRYTEEATSDASRPQVLYGSCPDCESPLVRRQSFRGPFLGCSNYPRCRHTRNLPSEAVTDKRPAQRGGSR